MTVLSFFKQPLCVCVCVCTCACLHNRHIDIDTIMSDSLQNNAL